MNASINYSGFVDLLEFAASEKDSGADQQEGAQQEPVMKRAVEQGLRARPSLREVPRSD